MNLAHTYAAVLTQLDSKDAVDKVVARMKRKGHLSLLPQILKILERETPEGEIITVANKKDETSIKQKFPTAHITIDPHIVGGYVRRSGSEYKDASIRRALVSIYQKAIGQI